VRTVHLGDRGVMDVNEGGVKVGSRGWDAKIVGSRGYAILRGRMPQGGGEGEVGRPGHDILLQAMWTWTSTHQPALH